MINKALVEYTKLSESKIMKLSEESKSKMTDKIISRLYKKIQKKSKYLDLPDIENSAGDIDKLYAYSDIKSAISFLDKIAEKSSNKELKELLIELKYSDEFLHKHKKAFTTGYRKNNSLLKGCYFSIVGSMVYLTSYAICSCLVFVNNGVMFEAKAAVSSPKIKRLTSFRSLKQILDLDRQNKIEKLFKECISLNEAVISAAWLGIALLVLSVIRASLHLPFLYRVKFSEYLNTIKDYVELNLVNVRDPQIKAKQQKWVTRLEKIRDRIIVDQEVSNARAEEEIAQEDEEIFNTSFNPNEDDLGLL